LTVVVIAGIGGVLYMVTKDSSGGKTATK